MLIATGLLTIVEKYQVSWNSWASFVEEGQENVRYRERNKRTPHNGVDRPENK